MNPTLILDTTRQHAAKLSGGKSDDSIYRTILGAIDDYDLRGVALDFGAGVGSLTWRLVQSGRFTAVAAADLMSKPKEMDAVQWICADLNDSLPISDKSFDCIVAAEVIEHLENPRAMARELFRLLKPGGTAVVSTPNNESWRSLISLLLRGHHVAFCDSSYPAHITALLRKDLERIFSEAGFAVTQFLFTDHGGLPGRPSVSWQQLTAGELRGIRFSDNMIAICRKPVRGGTR